MSKSRAAAAATRALPYKYLPLPSPNPPPNTPQTPPHQAPTTTSPPFHTTPPRPPLRRRRQRRLPLLSLHLLPLPNPFRRAVPPASRHRRLPRLQHHRAELRLRCRLQRKQHGDPAGAGKDDEKGKRACAGGERGDGAEQQVLRLEEMRERYARGSEPGDDGALSPEMETAASGLRGCELPHAIRAPRPPAPAAGEGLYDDPADLWPLLDPATRRSPAPFRNPAGQRRGQGSALGAWAGLLQLGELGVGSDGGTACGEAWVLVESGSGEGGGGERVGGCGEEKEACGHVVGVGAEGAGEGGEGKAREEQEESGGSGEGRSPITPLHEPNSHSINLEDFLFPPPPTSPPPKPSQHPPHPNPHNPIPKTPRIQIPIAKPHPQLPNPKPENGTPGMASTRIQPKIFIYPPQEDDLSLPPLFSHPQSPTPSNVLEISKPRR